MSRFVLEVRRQDGQHYPPNTLHQLCCGVMRYVREVKPDLDIFKDQQFSDFRRTLDAEMKRLRSLGIGTTTKQAEPITDAEEQRLFDLRKLGPDTPQSLLDTMVYMCGLYFALRSGQEHRNLSVSQIKLVEPTDGIPHLVYTENVSKNNPGGLHKRKLKPKMVIHHANVKEPNRCFVMFYKAYMAHRPQNLQHDAFYLTPIRNPKTEIWYSSMPVGYRTLMTTVNRLCKSASIDGYKTNHSLRVTAATRLFQQGVDEQLIMLRTGHRSIDGVRTYKRVSKDQQQVLSNVLNRTTEPPPTKKVKTAEGQENAKATPPPTVTTCTVETAEGREIAHTTKSSPLEGGQPSVTAPRPNVSGGIVITGCSHITVNYHTVTKEN